MHVVVVGCGRVGSGLARTLEDGGHTVAVVDKQSKAFRRLPEDFAGRTVVGVGFDRDRLEEAGIKEAGALAAVTNGDNSNILVARVAREFFGVDKVVARIYDARRAQVYERLGIPTVEPATWAIDRVLRKILPDSTGMTWVDPSAKVGLVERTIGAAWAGRPLSAVTLAGVANAVATSRLGVAGLPDPKAAVQEGDTVWFMVSGDGLDAFDAHFTGPAAVAARH